MWIAIGLVLSVLLAAWSWRNAARSRGYYATQVYVMTGAAHRRYAAAFLAFALLFALAWALRATALGLYALAPFALLAIFYGSSFLRGAEESEP